MNLTSIYSNVVAEARGQSSSTSHHHRHEATGYLIDRLNSFNLSSNINLEPSLTVWKEDSRSHLSHSGFDPYLHLQRSNQTSEYTTRGMPRSKRRAPSSTNHQQGLDPGAHEEVSRHPSKRIRHMSSARQHKGEDVSSYSQKRCTAWFREYTTADDPDMLGPEGMEKFCEDIGVEPENVVMLVLAFKMQARQMGFFTLNEWLKGLSELQCDTIAKVQNKLDYLRNLINDPHTFKGIYRYAYDFARDKDQRSMDMETARVMLQLLLGKHWPLFSQFAKFLDQSKYKVINKDQWCNILEFSRTISDDLSNYDLDGAWPVMLDEFVEWLKVQEEGSSFMETRTS